VYEKYTKVHKQKKEEVTMSTKISKVILIEGAFASVENLHARVKTRLHMIGAMIDLNQSALKVNRQAIKKAWRLAHPVKKDSRIGTKAMHKRGRKLRALNRDRTVLLTWGDCLSGERSFLLGLLGNELSDARLRAKTLAATYHIKVGKR
jgi:hypothetical protein